MQNLIARFNLNDEKVSNALASTVSVVAGAALIWAGLSNNPTAVATRNGLRDSLTGLASSAVTGAIAKSLG